MKLSKEEIINNAIEKLDAKRAYQWNIMQHSNSSEQRINAATELDCLNIEYREYRNTLLDLCNLRYMRQ